MNKILLCVLFCLPGMLALGEEFFVAPDGSDKNPGTKEKPFASLVAARGAARASAGKKPGGTIVNLRGGVYRFDKAVQFGPEDSGKPDAKMIYRAFGEEKPVLSGGMVVTGWQVHDAAKHIYKANVGKALFRQVYVNGAPGVLARYPAGTIMGPYLRMVGAEGKKHRIAIKAEDWQKAAEKAGLTKPMEIVYNLHWVQCIAKIGSVTEDGDKVWLTIAAPEPKFYFVKPDKWFPNSVFCLQNAPGFLETDNAWYHDAETGMLYLKVRNDADIQKLLVEIPRPSTLIEISGTPEKMVHDLEFQGLCLEMTNWPRPAERGMPATQFAQPYDTAKSRSWENLVWPQGILKARHAERLGIRNCEFRNAGATGIQFWMHVNDSDIEGNKIYQIAANGIEVDAESARNPKPTEQSVNVAIWNNNIHHCGQTYTNGGGIYAHFVKDLIVEHNEIHDMPYSGMQVGDQPGKKEQDCGCNNNKIRYNHIHHCMLLHDDGGAIYTLGGQQKGTVIAENYLHDQKRSKWTGEFYVSGVYLDNFTQFVTVRHNVLANTDPHTPYGEFNGAKQNKFIENGGKDPKVISNAGISKGYNPRKSTETE